MESFTLVIFGITSNLAQIKLIPALYDIAAKGLLPENTTIIGIARQPRNKREFQEYFERTLYSKNKHHLHNVKKEVVNALLQKLHYIDGNVNDPSLYDKLKNYFAEQSTKGITRQNKIFYLATYPDLYQEIFENLDKSQLNSQEHGWVRLMIEKPIGNDLPSAQNLNHLLLKYFQEEQIYRLDHYLGKETLQNILTFRFSNGIFEPLMNSQYIDHIQISALEDFGIGKRGGYYDSVGAVKDVGQNHLLQMIAFATMDAPSEFSNDAITRERVKVLKSLRPIPNKLVLGQYEGYTDEENINPQSRTETYFAFVTEVQNERFKGVPIYVRGGKKLAQTATEISIVFKTPHNRLLKHMEYGEEPNILTYRIQPNEGIGLQILSKKPGLSLEIEPAFMQFCYSHLSTDLPDPYERLILDAIKGDPSFFNDSEEIESQWNFIDKIQAENKEVHKYTPGTYGPQEADELLEKETEGAESSKYRKWLVPSENFCKT